jgi:hypothetical protein
MIKKDSNSKAGNKRDLNSKAANKRDFTVTGHGHGVFILATFSSHRFYVLINYQNYEKNRAGNL